MKKGTLVVISTILVVIGLILLVSSLSLTGSVISEKIGKTTGSILGLVFIIGGVILFMGGRIRRPVKYNIKQLEDLVATGKESIILLDSSGAIDYKNQMKDILEKFPKEVYMPDRIMEELGKGFEQRYGRDIKTIRFRNYGKHIKSAREKLEETPKHQDYLMYVRGKKERLGHREREKLLRKIGKVRGYLRKEGLEDNPEKVDEFIEKNWKVSKGDVTFLAAAIDAARHRKETNIVAHDTHIRDAVLGIKRKNKKIGEYLNYINYREYVEVA